MKHFKLIKNYIYYAHHILKYGTETEKEEMSLIKENLKDLKILNPNGDIRFTDTSNGAKTMEECFAQIRRNNVTSLAFSAIDGVVGKGVYDEVKLALKLNKNVYYIETNNIHKCSKVDFEIIDINWKYYALVKQYA